MYDAFVLGLRAWVYQVNYMKHDWLFNNVSEWYLCKRCGMEKLITPIQGWPPVREYFLDGQAVAAEYTEPQCVENIA